MAALGGSLTIRTATAENLTVTVDVPHDWPWPAAEELKPASVRVLAADGIPYHRREAIEALTAELAADAADAGQDNQGGLLNILLGLEQKLVAYARIGAGTIARATACNTDTFPPTCECFEGFGNDDCSHVGCPNACSGRGACDGKQVCSHDAETGGDGLRRGDGGSAAAGTPTSAPTAR